MAMCWSLPDRAGKSGAALMSGRSALRAGAGLGDAGGPRELANAVRKSQRWKS